jgi:hypothetical protein
MPPINPNKKTPIPKHSTSNFNVSFGSCVVSMRILKSVDSSGQRIQLADLAAADPKRPGDEVGRKVDHDDATWPQEARRSDS